MTPMVGIFWYDCGHVISFADSLDHATATGDFVDSNREHYKTWERLVRSIPKFQNMEYEDVPRGRVVYNRKRGTFVVYSSSQLVNDRKFRYAIFAAFNLKSNESEFNSDIHYEDPSSINWN